LKEKARQHAGKPEKTKNAALGKGGRRRCRGGKWDSPRVGEPGKTTEEPENRRQEKTESRESHCTLGGIKGGDEGMTRL